MLQILDLFFVFHNTLVCSQVGGRHADVLWKSDILTIVAVAIFCKGYTDHLVAFWCTFGELHFSILHRLKCKLYLALCPIQYNGLLSKNWSG